MKYWKCVILINKSTQCNFMNFSHLNLTHIFIAHQGGREKSLLFSYLLWNLCVQAANKNSNESEIIDERVERWQLMGIMRMLPSKIMPVKWSWLCQVIFWSGSPELDVVLPQRASSDNVWNEETWMKKAELWNRSMRSRDMWSHAAEKVQMSCAPCEALDRH